MNYPKLHNAMWPGLVGKGGDEEGAEPPISLDRMLELTAGAPKSMDRSSTASTTSCFIRTPIQTPATMN